MPDQLPWTYDFPVRIAIPFAIWLFCVGGCIGSFLNVVVYRLPRGMNLSRPRSRCPRCGQPIRWFNNIPILSWFVLRGRCRDCSGPIASRYMLVELLVATLFLTLGISEPITAGQGLPALYTVQEINIWMVYATHLALLVTILGVALIQQDGQPVPLSLFWPLLAILAASLLLTDTLYPQPLHDSASQLMTLLVGLGSGLLAGSLAWLLELKLAGRSDRAVLVGLSLAGAALGWQLTVLMGSAVLLLFLLLQLLSGGRLRLSILMLVFTLTALLVGRWQAVSSIWF